MDEGQHVKQFDSLEAMMAYMAEEEDRANASVHPQQRSIGPGEYVIRPEGAMLIFGYLYDTDDRRHTRPGGDLFERGYRTGFWSSEVLPGGESGDAHIINLWRIMKEEYQQAMDCGWETEEIIRSDWGKAMFRRLKEEQANTRGAAHDNAGAGFVAAEEDPS